MQYGLMREVAGRLFDVVQDSDTWTHYDTDPTPAQRNETIEQIVACLRQALRVLLEDLPSH
jgi:hypothetical protein